MPVTLFTDNKSLYDAIKSSKYVQNKRLRIDIAAVKESINTKQQLADPRTKSGANMKLLLNMIMKGSILVNDT